MSDTRHTDKHQPTPPPEPPKATVHKARELITIYEQMVQSASPAANDILLCIETLESQGFTHQGFNPQATKLERMCSIQQVEQMKPALKKLANSADHILTLNHQLSELSHELTDPALNERSKLRAEQLVTGLKVVIPDMVSTLDSLRAPFSALEYRIQNNQVLHTVEQTGALGHFNKAIGPQFTQLFDSMRELKGEYLDYQARHPAGAGKV